MKQAKVRRKRGILLTNLGLQRLQAAILAVEMAQNHGNRFSLEELSDRVKVSTRTLGRLWSLNASVDQRTLKLCFSAFNLELCPEDYIIQSELDEDGTKETLPSSFGSERYSYQPIAGSYPKKKTNRNKSLWYFPDGPIPQFSPLYIERPPIEKQVYQEITQPGSAIKIHASRGMGKSSLVLHLLALAQNEGYHTVKLDCDQIDSSFLSDLDKFLRCFCWQVARELGIPPNLDDNWDGQIGSKLNCTFYWKYYLLKQIKNPVVLVFERVDGLFEYPKLAAEFFALLRYWYEEARYDSNWQKLRQVVVCSTEVYSTLDINSSPFNIGLPIHLSEFTQQQVKELAKRYGLNWDYGEEVTQLMSLVGGNPALIQIALYYIRCQEITLDLLINSALADGGVYKSHLWRHWLALQEKPSLLETYTKIVAAKQSICLDPIEIYKLDSLGLIGYEGSRIIPRYKLYHAYFKKRLFNVILAD